MARVNDPTAPLNVRSQPQVAEGNIVGQLDDRVWVTITGEESGWWRISDPEQGWISKNLTDSTCTELVAQLAFPPNATTVRLSDRIVGAGFHEYRLEAVAQQTMTITAVNDSPLPFVRAPNGREITDAASMQGRRSWTGQLPSSGEYILEYNSNFQGFAYETLIEIR
ncbi:SH3 domain-containing protein [Sodalinema gerasimenkoae]|uniref:SH3 domain-containing protein n=1 Tax=Sodalinema gerasimenkoae TaxID=2862348 RepID=UPI001356CC00|nr:SH3 domain-containing protein [Sodalinema gerasimenkoae]